MSTIYEVSRDEIFTEAIDDESRRNLETCFERGQLPITLSVAGNERIRAHLPDPNDSIQAKDAVDIGIVKLSHGGKIRYIAEKHFPRRDLPTDIWEFNPETNELWVLRQDDTLVRADQDDEMLFSALTKEMAAAYSFNNYQDDLHPYRFQLEDLW